MSFPNLEFFGEPFADTNLDRCRDDVYTLNIQNVFENGRAPGPAGYGTVTDHDGMSDKGVVMYRELDVQEITDQIRDQLMHIARMQANRDQVA